MRGLGGHQKVVGRPHRRASSAEPLRPTCSTSFHRRSKKTMGTNGNSDDFDSISIDFFRQGEEGDDAFWDEEEEGAPSDPNSDALDDLSDDEEEPQVSAPLEATPPSEAPGSMGTAAATEPLPLSESRTIIPASAASDRSIFSAPTMIVPAGQSLYADEEDSHDVSTVPPPELAEPAEALHEETLFDPDSALAEPDEPADGDMFGDLGGAEETLEVFGAPTQEAPRSLVEELLANGVKSTADAAGESAPASFGSEADGAAPSDADADADESDHDEEVEASAEDFVDMAEEDPSLVMRRDVAPTPGGDSEAAVMQEDSVVSDAALDAPEPAGAESTVGDETIPPPPPVPASDDGPFTAAPAETAAESSGEADASSNADAASAALDGEPASPPATSGGISSEIPVLSTRPADSTDEAWLQVLERLEGLESRAEGSLKGGFAAEAGRLAIEHAGDAQRAEQLLARAVAAGLEHPALLAAYSIAVGALGDHPRLRDLLVRRGDQIKGASGADLLQDAALVERHQLGREQSAVHLLERAVEYASDDPTAHWFGLQLLRDLHTGSNDWGAAAAAISQMAGIAAPGEAATFWLELAALREEHHKDWSGALSAYMKAIEDGSTDPQAFVGAERCATHAGEPSVMAALFDIAAERADGADAAFWRARQARALTSAGAPDRTLDAWRQVIAEGAPSSLRLEAYAALADQSEWGDLHAALLDESGHTDGMGRAWSCTWAAEIAEVHLSDPELATSDLRAALEGDAPSEVVHESLERMLVAAGRTDEAATNLTQRISSESDPNRLLALHFRLAELHERTLADMDKARKHYDAVLAISPAYLPALDGLERCAAAGGDWGAVVSLHERRADVSQGSSPSAGHLLAAALVCEHQQETPEQALDLYRRALEAVPSDVVALDGFARVAAAIGQTDGLVDALKGAANAAENDTLRVSLLYRLAGIQQRELGDLDGARNTLQACVEQAPAFRPAAAALAGLLRATGAWTQFATLEAAAADVADDPDEKIARLLAAARAARREGDPRESEFIQEALRIDRDHEGARTEADLRAISAGDLSARQALLQERGASSDSPGLQAMLADLFAAVGDQDGATAALEAAMAQGGEVVAPSFLAAMAIRLNEWAHAVALMEAGNDWSSAGATQALRLADPEAAMAAWDKAESVSAAIGQVRLAGQSADREAMESAHRTLAERCSTPGLRGLNAVFAGRLAAARGDVEAATSAYRLGLSDAPARGRVVDGLLRAAVDASDVEALSSLLAQVEEIWPGESAELLAEAGDHVAAAAGFRSLANDETQAPAARFGLWIRAERSLMEADDWRGVLDCLRAQAGLVEDAITLEDLAARQRWILAEKLADSDDAWEQYQQLHEADPSNAEVLEALARIAGARGLTDQAIEYLDALSTIAPDAGAAARYRRRVAEIHLLTGNKDAAQEELSKSIELIPDDADTLSALRELAEEQEDWNAVVGVLSREASVMEGEERVGRLRRIASLWEEQIEEPAVAMDAWRKVLSIDPEDSDALTHLVMLSRQTQDWTTFAEVAATHIDQISGPEQAALQAELGVVLLRQLYNEESAVQYLEQASRGDHAQASAAVELERIYLSAGLWDKAIEVMIRRADASEAADRVACLLRAARTCLEMTGNRETVSSIYARVLETAPDNTVALRFQADHLYKAGNMEGAAVVFERLEADYDELDIDEEDEDDVLEIALSLFRFGQVLEQLGRGSEAILRYEKVGEINPAHLPSLEAVGPLYLEAGEWKKAGKAYRQILRLTSGQGDPARLARTYTSLGRVELQLGNLDKAERRFAKALQVRPNDISALTGSADVLLRRGDSQTGEQRSDTWRRLLTVYNSIIYHAQTPEEVVYAYLTKGFVLDARLDLADKAAQHYRKSLAFDGAQPRVLLRLAEHALRRQDWPEAESLATQGLALELVPADQKAGLHLVRYCAFSSCGDSQAAKDELDAARATGDEAFMAGLSDSEPGAAAVHEALRARLSAKL